MRLYEPLGYGTVANYPVYAASSFLALPVAGD